MNSFYLLIYIYANILLYLMSYRSGISAFYQDHQAEYGRSSLISRQDMKGAQRMS